MKNEDRPLPEWPFTTCAAARSWQKMVDDANSLYAQANALRIAERKRNKEKRKPVIVNQPNDIL